MVLPVTKKENGEEDMKSGLENYKKMKEEGVYLDNAATSFPKPACVWEAMEAYMGCGSHTWVPQLFVFWGGLPVGSNVPCFWQECAFADGTAQSMR